MLNLYFAFGDGVVFVKSFVFFAYFERSHIKTSLAETSLGGNGEVAN